MKSLLRMGYRSIIAAAIILMPATTLGQSNTDSASVLARNPCVRIEVAKFVASSIPDNPNALETLGILQLACASANNTPNRNVVAVKNAVCSMEIAAGDAFTSAAGVHLTTYVSPKDDSDSLRASWGLRDWVLAEAAYSQAMADCDPPAAPDKKQSASDKLINALRQVRDFAAEVTAR